MSFRVFLFFTWENLGTEIESVRLMKSYVRIGASYVRIKKHNVKNYRSYVRIKPSYVKISIKLSSKKYITSKGTTKLRR
ncbi:hypothetical protein JOC95_001643 [Bacillus tianshenii]|uniref:Uncharacterized protein n=1 Tax=Sutcliffiella tianshenii TaxID=1463404 RepID=A0ABS2NYS2_9BACI|nr:hypothetical protein [Bacillus tianshenii]